MKEISQFWIDTKTEESILKISNYIDKGKFTYFNYKMSAYWTILIIINKHTDMRFYQY